MKKRLAILFASLSLCACGFIGCDSDDDDNGGDQEQVKLDNGKDCKANDECKSGLCKEDGDKKVCAAKDNGGDGSKIADGAECASASDECATAGFKCLAKGGDGDDAAKLICKQDDSGSGSENNKIADGAECASADDECATAGFKCLAKGGDGDDKDKLICKAESGSGSEGGDNLDNLDAAALNKKLCEHKHECSIETPGLDDNCEALGPVCVAETKAYYQCQIDAEQCAEMSTGCMEQMNAFSSCSSAALNDPNAARGSKEDAQAISELYTQLCDKNVECETPGYTAEMCHPVASEPKCVDENKAYIKCQINAECAAFADAATLCKAEKDALDACNAK